MIRGEPYQWVVELEMSGKINGNVLDSGCGTGDNSIFLASKGYNVVGLDISSNAIKTAKSKAIEGDVHVEFDQADMCRLNGFENKFDTVLDIGCFHSLDENQQVNYTNSLHEICNSDAVIYLRGFSDANSKEGYPGPAVSKEDYMQSFLKGMGN